jgi:Tol biopolymer transport system component/tRNA A-37 threonylcarbamoyl transferase component Bud32
LDRLKTAIADRYTILRELGSGGMATVYLAEDVKHHRRVAVNVLRPELAAVLGAERFVQEITTTANLQHPHILPLFDSGEAEGFLYYVMPYIEGETLREKLNRETQLGIDEAVKITTEVADALDSAHQQGVIHRDIKPENILLHAGRPMVADFGIALAVSAAAGGRMTETGLSLGTPHYMSPEQATAERDITNRSDVYSLGAVLYEMLTGDPPHTGSSAQQIIMKIVTEEVAPVTRWRKSVPRNVALALANTLEKLPADRFESAAKFGEALTNPAFGSTTALESAAGTRDSRSWNRLTIGLAGLATLFAVAAVWGWLGRESSAVGAGVRLLVAPEDVQILAPLGGDPLAFSPDGQTLAFIGRASSADSQAVYLRDLGDFQPRRLANTNGAASVFFSPDGAWIGFKVDRQLFKIPREGGAPIPLASNARMQRGTASWGPDGAIVYARIGTPQRIGWVGENGGPRESLLPPDWSGTAQWPTYLPNGLGIVFQVCESYPCANDRGVHLLDFQRKEVRLLVENATRGWVLPSGHLLYSRADGAALAAPFDLEALELTGPAIPVLEDVQTGIDGVGRIVVSTAGHVAYLHGAGRGARELVRVSRAGEIQPLPIPPREFLGVQVSPDGSRLAATVLDDMGASIWILSADGTSQSRVSASGFFSQQPLWILGGSSIVFVTVDTTGARLLAAQPVDLSNPVRTIARFDAESRIRGISLTPDGSRLYFGLSGPNTQGYDLFVVPTDGASEPEIFFQTAAMESFPAVSTDGRWVAYVSNESGTVEVYVRRADGTGGRQPVSSGEAQEPVWSRTGSELFYRGSDGLYSVTVSEPDRIQVVGRQLFDDSELSRRFVGYVDDVSYDVEPAGEHFVMIRNRDQRDVRIQVVLNFFEELKAKVGN